MQYAKGKLTHTCDFDPECGQQFASRDDLDRHEREHWANLPDPDGSNTLPVPDGPWFHEVVVAEPGTTVFQVAGRVIKR